jgi:hypothetical protein
MCTSQQDNGTEGIIPHSFSSFLVFFFIVSFHSCNL